MEQLASSGETNDDVHVKSSTVLSSMWWPSCMRAQCTTEQHHRTIAVLSAPLEGSKSGDTGTCALLVLCSTAHARPCQHATAREALRHALPIRDERGAPYMMSTWASDRAFPVILRDARCAAGTRVTTRVTALWHAAGGATLSRAPHVWEPHAMMHIPPYTTLTHVHALTGQHAYDAALLFICAYYTTNCLLAFVRTFISSTYAHIHTYVQA